MCNRIYKIIYLLYIVLQFYINIVYGEDIKLNVVAYADTEYNDIYSSMIEDFNDYAKENHLNITAKINIHTNADNKDFESFANTVESLLKKKANKYDIYFYDNAYTVKYGPYLLNLKDHLSEELIKIYNKDLIEKTCTYEDKIIGIPFNIAYSMLYSNYILLDKYNKTIPKTWDELIETSKYIIEQENDPNLIAYNGLFDEGENGICSIYEFIYSFRDSVDSPFPDIRSETAVKALNYIKRMKNEIGSDEIFRSDFVFGLNSIRNANSVFVKFYTLTYSMLESVPYKMTPLPGYKEGVSGAIIAGYNVGIDGIIPKKKLNAAVTALKFLTSKELQKKYFLIENVVSGIDSLYDDEEICAKTDCPSIKSVQPINRPSSKYYQFSDYIKKFSSYVYQHIYGNETAESVLEKIEDLTKIHSVSIKEKNSAHSLALSIFIFVFTFSLLMIGLLVLLFSERMEKYFSYLTKDEWIMSICGLVVIISNCYTTFGPVTSTKCDLYVILLIIGYTLNLVPIFYQLIIGFPEHNKITEWANRNKYIFILLFLLCDLAISLLFLPKIFDVDLVLVSEGKNFETCVIRNSFGVVLLTLVLILFLLVLGVMLVLCYIEWGRKTFIYDIHFFVVALYFDAFSVVLSYIFNFISYKDYIFQFIIRNVLTLIPVITSYMTIYGFRLYIPFHKEKEEQRVIYSLHKNTVTTSSRSTDTQNKHSLVLKLRDYHNQSMEASKSIDSFSSRFSNDGISKSNNNLMSKNTDNSGFRDSTENIENKK
ncbi:periplasmic binding protein-like II [Anaeromyces robustus]|uniref:Periplasmic binding protein-like II n=1 Tax=Anaeromyces robustus TaxID=1754192 RepID=A0A1Y1XBW2_9FUNG|nr:periplasmic binding protein-like II [Anaeromyces robustus]|eukprot:ORX83229.1 periplasmic binding protein-like II [Anaeromyces robustus]